MSAEPVIVRFAPSPTGYLHVGNIRTAIVNWLFAKKLGGKFLLRMDDTDTERSKKEFEDGIQEDLRWLGLEWDGFFRESERFDRYEDAKQKLIASGRLYPCYETAEEIDVKRKMMASRGLPPIYDRAALKLTDAERAKLEAEGRKPHYRFKLEDKPIQWNDLVRGAVKFEGTHVSDPVLVREDGVPLYTLSSVVDDGDTYITHILRGEDHVSNTAVQMQIFEALGIAAPTFGHLALIKTKEGELSKRTGGGDIRSLREQGIEPMAINSLLAKIGTSDAIELFSDLDALIASFDISKFGRAAAIYDQVELERLNTKRIAQLPFAAVKDKLPEADEAFWLAVRANIKTVADANQWLAILHDESLAGLPADADFLSAASGLLPTGDWDDTTWGVWTKAVAASSGRKGKELFLPLRLALTGVEHGPEMSKLLPLLGRERVVARLKSKANA